jgi:hypothetical protein
VWGLEVLRAARVQRRLIPAASMILAKMETVCSSETSVNLYQSSLRYNSEDGHVRIQVICRLPRDV